MQYVLKISAPNTKKQWTFLRKCSIIFYAMNLRMAVTKLAGSADTDAIESINYSSLEAFFGDGGMANEEIRLANIEAVLQTAINLFVENGIENTTREMLARTSGVSRRSTERYFPCKADCVVQASQWFAKSLTEGLESVKMLEDGNYPAEEVLRKFFDELKQSLLKEPRIYIFFAETKGFIYRNCKDRAADYKNLLEAIGWRRILQKIFEKGEQDGTLKGHFGPEKTARYLANTMVSFFSNLVLLYDKEPDMLESCVTTYLTDMWNLYFNQ